MKTLLAICIAIVSFSHLAAQYNADLDNKYLQQPAAKYWVYFSDKSNTSFSVNQPADFLSARSIERRMRAGIKISEHDLPVSDNYIQAVENIGAKIIVQSRWLNAVSVEISTMEQLTAITQLQCVKQIQPVKKYKSKNNPITDPAIATLRTTGDAATFYGASANQFTMINGDFLHNLGYTGQGMLIAVLDAGFAELNSGIAYNSFWEKQQIKGVYNFPDANEDVYFSSYHGTYVLAIMGADVPGSYVGASPDAEFYLFRTEVSDSERVAEEDFWLAAAEMADIVGADIINSSLGYTTFDDTLENHTYADMDGNTTIVTKAADWAASKGILVCNSAGNEGASTWNYIGAPADGDSVFTIGAVDRNANYASFSSNGPTFDGRIKPNIATQGSDFPVLYPSGSIGYGGGTSFASPLAAGAAACLWQAFPEKSNMEIMDAIQKSASQYLTPDTLLGYGIPDMALAYLNLLGAPTEVGEETLHVFAEGDEIYVFIYSTIPSASVCMLFDAGGRKVLELNLQESDIAYNAIRLNVFDDLPTGLYALTVKMNNTLTTKKVFIR